MKINLMTHYAIKTINSIALNGGDIVTSTYISEDQGRGEISGGYSLSVSVNEITRLNIIESMEGPIEGLFFAR